MKFDINMPFHYCPDVVSFPADNVLQNSHLHSKQVLFDLNSDSLYNPLLKGGRNEFRENDILANNGLLALVAVSLDRKTASW